MLSHTGHVMTLANSIIGASILAMPFCFQKCGIVLATLLLIGSNWITRVCCHYLIKSSFLTRRKSAEFLGFHAFGSSGKLFVELCIIGYLLGTCITYFVVVGDLGPQIIIKMLTLDRDFAHLRFYFMCSVTLLAVLPLAMLKNVDSLSAVCTASIGFYVCLVIKVILESESHILANDWAANVVYWQPSGVLQCLPIFSMALSCQMQLFEVFKSVTNQSVEKLNGIVRDATWICTLVYIAVGFFGYVAFCTQTFSGNILLNFSPSFGSDVIKIGFILSVAFSFPLVIFPCRASIYSLLYRKGHTDASGGYIPETRFKMITTFIVGLTLCIALIIPSVELIIGLVGSTIGVAICVMFPAACFRKITMKSSNNRPVTLSSIILVGGFCLMVLGTYANLQAIDEHSSGAHLESKIVKNNLLKSTEITAVKDEAQRLIKEKLNVLEGKKIINLENSKLPQAEVKKENNLNRLEVQKGEKMDKIIIPAGNASPVPVFPVDEKHNDDEKIKISDENDKNAVLEMPKLLVTQNLSNNVYDKKDSENAHMILLNNRVLTAPSPSISSYDIVIPSITNKTAQQQNIDKDAIKKDEEVAAEERNGKTASKNAEDELKKTQNELQKTKELLERKVDEMKEELVKQNKETQNLVVEKLVEVVEKVEKIEREVQKKDEEGKVVIPMNSDAKIAQDLVSEKLAEVAKKVGEIEQKVQQQNQEKNLKAETSKSENKINIIPAEIINEENKKLASLLPNIPENDINSVKKAQVYEPLSYKTGEIIESVRNGTKLEHNLPLPLPLLINASRNKPNDIEVREESINIVNLDEQKLPLENVNITNSVQLDIKNPDHMQPSLSKENIEAIRREILELKTKTTVKPLNDLTESQKRFKRSFNMQRNIFDLNVINSKLTGESSLSEPKLDNLLQHGSSGALDFKKHSIGRDLKSLEDEKHEDR